MALSRSDIIARSIRLNPTLPVNPYTGTLNDPFEEAQSTYAGPGWDQFFGGLAKTREDAENAGQTYRIGWNGFGTGTSQETTAMPRRANAGYLPAGDAPGDDEAQRTIAGNAALDQMTDEQRARVRIAQELQDKDQSDAIAGLQRGYLGQVAASAVPVSPAPVTSSSFDAAGNPSFTMRPNPTETPEQRLLTLAPGAAQPALQQQAAANALANRKQTEAENPYGIFLQKPGAAGPQGLPTDANGAPLTGDALLSKVAPPVAATVRAVLDGRQAIPSGTATKDPYWKGVIALANQVDPNYDTVDYNARNKTRQDFTSGKSAQQINAINTVVGHLHDLAGAGTQLDNTGYDWMNSLRNRFLTSGGSTRGVALNNFNTLKEGVANELMRTWRQSGAGSEKEIEDWKSTIDASKSPEELQGAFKTVGGMLESKLGALDSQYKQGMGTQAVSAITPESRARLDALQGLGGTPDAQQRPIPGIDGGVAELRGGKWIRVK